MVDIPATGAIVVPTPEKEAPASKESMKDFLTEVEVPEKAEDTETEKVQDPPSADEESADEEEGTSDEEENEESESKGNKDDKPKKPSRYQRLKQRAETAQAEAKTARAEGHKATVVANQWYAEAMAIRDFAQKLIKEHKLQIDPRDLEVYQARRKIQDKELQEAAHSDFANRETQATQQAQRAELQQQFLEEADSLAEKFPGLTRKQILNAYAGVLEAEEEMSMSEVAENLATALKRVGRNVATKAQAAANQSAPRTINGRSSTPKYGRDTTGMKAFLKSTGLA